MDINQDIKESSESFAVSNGYADGDDRSNAEYCFAEGARWAYRKLFAMYLDGALSFSN